MPTIEPKSVAPEESSKIDSAWIPYVPLTALFICVVTLLIWAEVVT